MIRVFIADDHDLIRRGLKQMLSEVAEITVAGEAGTGGELLHQLSLHVYDVLLLDINLPGRNGLDLLKDIRKIQPGLPVLILSIYEEDQYIIGAINRGADGYVSKATDTGELIRAIEKVARGETYIAEHLAGKLLFRSKPVRVDKPHEALTVRELEVLKKIASGKPPKEIAAVLSISVKTVNAHREHILRKMKLKTTTDLIRYSLTHELI